RILTNYRFSVLIGPAGSGKTTLLKIFENIPEIRKGGVLKLAPTGKARVKLGHDAFTIAQFLYPERYDSYYGIYRLKPDSLKASTAKTVIIDESSMLTEEQLAAVFDALGPVDRIILVGDYRQLPPIGTGRPFVDIVDLLKPKSFPEAPIKVGPAYAELCQISRQSNDSSEPRLDVQLSKCFGDEVAKEDIELFYELSSKSIKNKHIRLEKWYDSKDFKELFQRVIEEELGIKGDDVVKAFNRTLGAVDVGDFQYFNCGYTEKQIENWQIISPVNGFGFGVKEVNKLIQTTYRKNFIDLAHQRGKKKIAKPKGSDNMVYGDKVINLQNARWEYWQKIKPKESKDKALNYIANGEIGVLTGYFRGKNDSSPGEPNIEITFSTQPGYSYEFYPKQFGEDSVKSYRFELAYAITVHKAQGSGFKKVFFVLPSKGAI
ncbi:MAG: AAA family ATPase, partial [Cyclobacteriaceae bacterium]|nr:AAA family ATPase [Cyclobacteriaceae bacterium]